MKTMKINNKNIKQLQKNIQRQQIAKFIQLFNQQNQQVSHKIRSLQQQAIIKDNSHHSNQIQNKERQQIRLNKLNKKSRQKISRVSLRNKANNDTVSNNMMQNQQTYRQGTTDQSDKIIIKDKAVFFNVSELPYLHSTDLLNNLYKRQNLEQKLTEQVILYNPSLNNPHLLTKLKSLHLYYCNIESLRDIGTGWSNLQQLAVYFGQLKDFSGLAAFPAIQYLHCPFNQIQSLSQLMFHPTIVSLDLQNNFISDFSQVQHLFTIQNLQYINLLNNPIYVNKQTKRKINQKFLKIIQSDNQKLNQYLKQTNRQQWELQNIQGIQQCNYLIKQFFQITKNDQINIQNKYLHKVNKQKNNTNGLNSLQNQSKQNQQKQLKIQYIPSEIPQNQQFQQLILNNQIQKHQQNYCQQKIILTPLIQMINHQKIFLGPVLNKYLMNKLVMKSQIQKPIIKSKLQSNNINNKFIKKEGIKLKKISSRTTLNGLNSNIISNNQSISNIINHECSSKIKNKNQSSELKQQIKNKQFDKTTTSISTNFTTQSDIRTLKRSKLSLTKSKQKSLTRTFNKLALPIHQAIINTQMLNTNNGSLNKQNRLFMNRNLLKSKQKSSLIYQGQQQRRLDSTRQIKKDYNQSIQKSSLSSTLKRRSMLSSKRNTFLIQKNNQTQVENPI